MGPTGITYTGSTGIQGAMGPQGPPNGPTGPTGMTGPTGGAVSSSSIVIATYSTGAIANAVAASNASVTYISQTSIPTAAKGKTGVLMAYFDMQTSGAAFISNTAFDYVVAIDGSNIGYGPIQRARYTQTVSSPNMIGSNGFTIGTGGLTPLTPMSIPVAISAGASMFQIGIANSTSAFGLSAGVAASSNSNTNVVNTATNYTVPSTANGSNVVGVFIYAWGGGANSWIGSCVGGGGGFVSGFYSCAPGTVLAVVGAQSDSGSLASGGSFRIQGTVNGGLAGVFLSNIAASNAICVAGGGGPGGSHGQAGDFVMGGAGGYPAGAAPFSPTSNISSSLVTGGTQTSGGISASNGQRGGQLTPGTIGVNYFFGGNGWYGGGGGVQDQRLSNGCGGGGGSSYIGNVNGATGGIGFTSGASFANGTTNPTNGASNAPPGGVTSPFYPGGVVGYGNNTYNTGNGGAVIIVPAVGTFGPVSVGVDARLVVI